MQDHNKTNPKDTSAPGHEEEVIPNANKHDDDSGKGSHITGLPAKDPGKHAETEGERRFKEGMANNNDTASS